MKFNKTHIYIAIAVVIVLVSLGIFLYHQGTKKVAIQALPGDLPGNPGSGNVTGASNDEIKRVAEQIYTDIDGYNVFGHNNAPYNVAVTFSDNDIVKLYNTFNTLYQNKLGETLRVAMENEKYYENDATDILISRFAKLNLI
jgi:hypothetical protein